MKARIISKNHATDYGKLVYCVEAKWPVSGWGGIDHTPFDSVKEAYNHIIDQGWELEVPPVVKECVGCGFCCKKTPCELAFRVYGNVTKCPSLIWDKEAKRYWCKIILDPIIGPKNMDELYIGAGCCCGLNTDRDNILPPEETATIASYQMAKETKILIAKLANQMISGDILWLTFNSVAHELNDMRFLDEALFIARQQRSSFNEKFMG